MHVQCTSCKCTFKIKGHSLRHLQYFRSQKLLLTIIFPTAVAWILSCKNAKIPSLFLPCLCNLQGDLRSFLSNPVLLSAMRSYSCRNKSTKSRSKTHQLTPPNTQWPEQTFCSRTLGRWLQPTRMLQLLKQRPAPEATCEIICQFAEVFTTWREGVTHLSTPCGGGLPQSMEKKSSHWCSVRKFSLTLQNCQKKTRAGES